MLPNHIHWLGSFDLGHLGEANREDPLRLYAVGSEQHPVSRRKQNKSERSCERRRTDLLSTVTAVKELKIACHILIPHF